MGEIVRVDSYKFDGRLHRSWKGELARREGSLLVLDAKFETEVVHPLLGTIEPGTHSVEFYWMDRWYNVFRFTEPCGAVRNFYCNVNEPPRLENGTLSYVDLDVDVLVAPDLTYRVLDLDEFEINSRLYGYPADVRRNVGAALEELRSLIEARQFPFGP